MSRDKTESEKGLFFSENCCVVCGWNKQNLKGESLVIGAHVRPFRNTPDYDKSDNIIGLCPNHHSEYDAGILTIDPLKKLSIHSDAKDSFHLKPIRGRVDHVKQGYFDYHLKHLFRIKRSV